MAEKYELPSNDELTGLELKAFRLKARMTRVELAEALGMNLCTIARQERGEMRVADPRMMRISLAVVGHDPPLL